MFRLFPLLFLISSFHVCAQQDIPVNLFMGTPVIGIPIWNLSAHGLNHQVALTYNSAGLKLEDKPENTGLGWIIKAGGKIFREIRGLPDDFNGIKEAREKVNGTTVYYDDRRGWLQNIVGSTIKPAKSVGDFIPSSDVNPATCSDELSDYNKLASYRLFVDTEPDMFHFSCGGISGSFVFDNSATPQIRMIPLQDIDINYTMSESAKDIIAFTITTNDGVVYHFNRPVKKMESVKPIGTNSFQFFERFSTLYSYDLLSEYLGEDFSGHTSYNAQWMLSKIKAPSGGEILFSYSHFDFEVRDTLNVGIRQDATVQIQHKSLYETYEKVEEQRLAGIYSSEGQSVKFIFNNANSLLSLIQVIDNRKVASPIVKQFELKYREVATAGSAYKRSFLESVQEVSGCDKLPPYKFQYIGVNFSNNTTNLPSSHSKAKDFWGYYNGNVENTTLYPTLYVYPSRHFPDKIRNTPIPGVTAITLPGADRNPDPVLMKIGSLNTIQYPMGGVLTIDYESNTYYDPGSNQTLIGPGLRVRAVTFFDGVNSSKNIRKELNYNESESVSSGRLVESPSFYIPTSKYVSPDGAVSKTYDQLAAGSAQELWDRLLVRTEMGNSQLSAVYYKTVSIKFPGTGYRKYEFNLPGSYGGVASGEWIPTENRFSRSAVCEPMGISNLPGPWRYPFAENPNFSHERGLLAKEYEFNEQGVLTKEVTNNYQNIFKQSSTAFKVWGLYLERYANSANTILYGKYYLLTDITKVLKSRTVKIIDAVDISKSTTQTSEFFYEGTNHIQLTRSTTTNSDGIVHGVKRRFPKDFGTIPANADKHAAMIGKLQSEFRNNVAIEEIRTIQKPGEVEKVLGASFIEFNDFNSTTPLPEFTYSLSNPGALSDFTQASVQLQEGVYKLIIDPRYEATRQFSKYESEYKLAKEVRDPITRLTESTIWGYNTSLPVAKVSHATTDQIAFSDFETVTPASFMLSESILGSGRTGNYSLHPSVALSKSITKGSASKYTLSFWIKTDGSSVIFDITIRDQSNSTTYFTETFSANSSVAGKFAHIKRVYNVSSFPSTFNLEIRGQFPPGSYTPGPSLLPVIDDVAFYPEHADVVAFTHQVPHGISSATDQSGITNSSVYDGLGRTKKTLDQDNNITKVNTYQFASIPDVLTASFDVFDLGSHSSLMSFNNDKIYVRLNEPIQFAGLEECHENVTFEWNFGSGFVAGQRETQHTFSSSGCYNVALRVSRPGYTTVIVTKEICVLLPLSICGKGIKEYNPTNNQVVATFPPCSEISATPAAFSTIFKIDHTYLIPTGTIEWKIRDFGSEKWKTISGGSDQVVIQNIDLMNIGFEVICEITDATTKRIKAKSNILAVTFSW